jgi:hypothetical protein
VARSGTSKKRLSLPVLMLRILISPFERSPYSNFLALGNTVNEAGNFSPVATGVAWIAARAGWGRTTDASAKTNTAMLRRTRFTGIPSDEPG